MKMNKISALVLAGAILALAGCGGPPPSAEEIVSERVAERWALLLERDFEHAWDYYTPGFRQMNPRFDFGRDMAARPVRWLAAELESLECEGDRCDVAVRVTYRAPAAPGPLSRIEMDRVIDEVWIRVDDNWWFASN